jgi:NlpC/P60 family putative phage cell wall peptidase
MHTSLSRNTIIAEARSWIGTPYRHQASLKGVGCDCLGLVRGVWRALLGPEPARAPAYTRDWAEAGGAESLAQAARLHLVEIAPSLPSPASGGGLGWGPGDVLLFRYRDRFPAKHAAIVTARDPDAPALMVHAHDGAAVAEVAIAPWWRRRLAYAFRFPDLTD